MIDKLLVEKKLRKIEEFIGEIQNGKIGSYDEFKENVIIKRFIERNLELALEQMIDICRHLVCGLDLKEPETYAECFEILAAGKVISKDTIGMFQSMARFRNMLIHIYDNVDDSVTYGIYMRHLDDFNIFAGSIRAYLKELN